MKLLFLILIFVEISTHLAFGAEKCCRSDLGYNPLHFVVPSTRGYCGDGKRAVFCCSTAPCDTMCCNCKGPCHGGLPFTSTTSVNAKCDHGHGQSVDLKPGTSLPAATPKPKSKKSKTWKNCPAIESRAHVNVNVKCECQGSQSVSYCPCDAPLPHGAIATYACDNFYIPIGHPRKGNKMTCHNGIWRRERSFLEFQCELDCRKRRGPSTTSTMPWPWHAAIFKKVNNTLQYICGGSLIDKSAVVTTASCLHGHPQTELRIILGVKSTKYSSSSSRGDVAKIFGIESIHPHQDFNPENLSNNIALINLNKDVEFSQNIRPICLAMEDDEQSLEYGEVIGFEKSNGTRNGTQFSSGEVRILDSAAECKNGTVNSRNYLNFTRKSGEEISEIENLTDISPELCSYTENTRSTHFCKGDSGGALIGLRAPNMNSQFLLGIVSRNSSKLYDSCENVTIYTRIHGYLHWIEDTLEDIRNPILDIPEEPYYSSESEEDM